MDQEQSWVTTQMVGDDDNTAATMYQHFMKPEPRDALGPIREIDDLYLGRTKVRDLRIGMTRNAKEENKKVVTAYLEPYPHTRIDTAKPLQGWYKGLHEAPGTRNRPCFTEAILTEPFGGWCAVGCAFSLPRGELVDTPYGSTPIESFSVGDWVYGRTSRDRRPVRVVGTSHHWKPEGLVVVTLSDGRRLKMTGDHPIYSRRRGWVAAESLVEGEGLEDASMSRLFGDNFQQEVLSALLADLESPAPSTSYRNVSGLLCGDTTSAGCLQELRFEDQSGERTYGLGALFAHQGSAQVSGDTGQDVCLRSGSQTEYVRQGEGTQVSRVQGSEGGGCSQWGVGLQAFKATSLQRQSGAGFQDEVVLGGVSSSPLRREGVRLGLRAFYNQTPEWGILRSRLSATPEQYNSRSQGLLHRECSAQDSGGAGSRLRDSDIRPSRSEEVRYPYVVHVERIPGAVEVFDIETETGNFYQRGVLVHNCYVNSGFRGYRGTGLITVPLNYGAQIRKQLSTMRRAAAGYFSSFTDPFTPLEDYYHNTEEAANEFVKVGLPVFFLSRLRYPDWALDLLTKNPHSYAQKSINTSDPEDWRRLSPGALPLEEHFNDIARIKARGIYVSIQCNPVVPGVTSNEQIITLFRRLKEAGADHVIVKFVEAGYSWAPAMVDRMIKRFGERGKVFARLFVDNQGGQRCVEESYRLRAHRLYSTYARRFGLTYATCYEYRYLRDSQGRIVDKTGVSIGWEFTTADQCHGHRVPMYARDDERELFRPLEECPPSGCLYCASENKGEPRCGDELAGQAQALRLSDLRQPMGDGQGRLFSLPVI